jgi:hypothetical protein
MLYLRNRASKGFNVVMMVVMAEHKSVLPPPLSVYDHSSSRTILPT